MKTYEVKVEVTYTVAADDADEALDTVMDSFRSTGNVYLLDVKEVK